MSENRVSVLWAIVAAIVSGTLSALTLDPIMQVMERNRVDDLLSILTTFALSAGLAFGLCGATIALWRMRVRAAAAGIFLVASMLGMAAAVYAAILTYDNAEASFMLPYAVGSPVGALILAVPFAYMGRFNHPWRLIGLATVLPTLWATGVGTVFIGDAAMEVRGLATLYIGWQALFLGVFAASGMAPSNKLETRNAA